MIFELSGKEEESAKEWITDQKKKRTSKTTIGGRFSYIFTITSVGNGIVVKDNLLNEKKDVTDYDLW